MKRQLTLKNTPVRETVVTRQHIEAMADLIIGFVNKLKELDLNGQGKGLYVYNPWLIDDGVVTNKFVDEYLNIEQNQGLPQYTPFWLAVEEMANGNVSTYTLPISLGMAYYGGTMKCETVRKWDIDKHALFHDLCDAIHAEHAWWSLYLPLGYVPAFKLDPALSDDRSNPTVTLGDSGRYHITHSVGQNGVRTTSVSRVAPIHPDITMGKDVKIEVVKVA